MKRPFSRLGLALFWFALWLGCLFFWFGVIALAWPSPLRAEPSSSASKESRQLCFSRLEVEVIRRQQITAEAEIKRLRLEVQTQIRIHEREQNALRSEVALLRLRLASAPVCPACPCTAAWATAASLGAAGIVTSLALFFVGHQQGTKFCKP